MSGSEGRPTGPVDNAADGVGPATLNDMADAPTWQQRWRLEARLLTMRAGTDPLGTAVRLAVGQGFVLTRAQVRSCGVDDATVRRLVRRGTWGRPSHGVVSVAPSAPPSLVAEPHAATSFDLARRTHALQAAAAVVRTRRHRISGASAAVVLGLPTMAVPDVPELEAVGATFGRRATTLVRVAGRANATRSWFGVPIVSTADAIVTLARFDARSGLMAADAALHGQLLQPAALEAALQRSARLPGIRRAREALTLASALIESPLESITHLAVRDAGLPLPQPQCRVRGAGGTWHRVDFLWRELRLILEADGRGKYVGDAGWREKRRELDLVRAGYRVVRVTWGDVMYDWPLSEAWLRECLGMPARRSDPLIRPDPWAGSGRISGSG